MSLSRDDDTYHLYKRMLIGKIFFQAGISVIKPQEIEIPGQIKALGDTATLDASAENTLLDGADFNFKDRQLHISTNSRGSRTSYLKETKKACELLKAINYEIGEPNVVIRNKKCRKEVFLPLILEEGEEKFGLYISPWTSHDHMSINKDFSGFTEFVTAVCMFGSSLEAVDNLGRSFTLIKPYIKFYQGQTIVRIKYNPNGANPYEKMMLVELEKLATLIKKFSKPNADKKLTIHLPWIDYILFGLKLFVKQQITFRALSSLIAIIITEQERYKKNINDIFSKHDIQLEFVSPFDNLFSFSPDDSHSQIMRIIFETLGLAFKQNNNELNDATAAQQEKELVQTCLNKLIFNEINLKNKAVWTLCSSTINFEDINNLEELFKYANAMVLVAATSKRNDYEVCSVLTISDNQTQRIYSSLCKNTDKLPAVFMISFLEPVYSYNPDVKDYRVFYYENQQHTDLVTAFNKGLIHKACQNVFLFSHSLSKAESNLQPRLIQEVLSPK